MDPENEWRMQIRNLSGTAGNEPVSKQDRFEAGFLYQAPSPRIEVSIAERDGGIRGAVSFVPQTCPTGIACARNKEKI